MLSSKFALASALIFTATSIAAPATFAASFQDKGESRAWITPATADAPEALNIVETRYFDMGYPGNSLLKAVIATTRLQGAEGMQANTELTMFADDKARLDKVAWTAKVEGSQIKLIDENLVGVVQYGCCAAPDTTRLFNTQTGQKVEAALGSIYELEVPNSYQLGKRYLSLAIDSKAPSSAQGKTYIGTFSYFTKNKIVSRVRVYADLPRGWGTELTEMKIIGTTAASKVEIHRETSVTLWNTDGQKDPAKAFSGVALESTLYYDKQVEKVRIAIEGDTLNAASSTATKGLYLEFVK